MEDNGCHLQNSASTMVYLPGSIAGDAMCTEEEKAKFEEHMRSLPRMGKHDAIPCEDGGLWFSMDPDDLLNSRNGEACSLFVFVMFTTEYQSQV